MSYFSKLSKYYKRAKLIEPSLKWMDVVKGGVEPVKAVSKGRLIKINGVLDSDKMYIFSQSIARRIDGGGHDVMSTLKRAMKHKKTFRITYSMTKTVVIDTRGKKPRNAVNIRSGELVDYNIEARNDGDYDHRVTIENRKGYIFDKIGKGNESLIKTYIMRRVYETEKNKLEEEITPVTNYRTIEIHDLVIKLSREKPVPLTQQTMNGIRLHSKLLDNVCDFAQSDSKCVIRYLQYLKNMEGVKKVDIIGQMNDLNVDILRNGASILDVIEWRDNHMKECSIYAFDGLQKLIKYSPAPSKKKSFTAIFICHDNHLYPITDKNIIKSVRESYKHQKDNTRLKIIDVNLDTHTSDIMLITPETVSDVIVGNFDNDLCVASDDTIYDISNLAGNIMAKSKLRIDIFSAKSSSKLDAFVHPVNNKIICRNNDYQRRLRISNLLFKEFGTEEFTFINQSLTNIATALFHRISGGQLFPSSHNNEALHYYKLYESAPITEKLNGIEGNVKTYDLCKSYSSVLYLSSYDFPHFSVFDSYKDYKGEIIEIGEYLLKPCVTEYETVTGEKFILNEGVYNYAYVKELLEMKLITKDVILKVRKASGYINHIHFNKFVKYVFEKFNEDDAKSLVNFFIGALNNKYDKTYNMAICEKDESLVSLLDKYSDDSSIYHYNVGGVYLIKLMNKVRKHDDNSPIWRQIINLGSVNVLKLMKSAWRTQTKLVQIKTDSVSLVDSIPPTSFQLRNKNDFPLDTLGKYKMESYRPLVNVNHKYIDGHIDFILAEYEPTPNENVILHGVAGSGKTEEIANYVKNNPDKRVLITSKTHCAVLNALSRCLKLNANTSNVTFMVFDSFMKQEDGIKDERLTQFDVIIYDELSMADNEHIAKLYRLWQKHSTKIWLVGHVSQIPSLSRFKYNFFVNKAVREMCHHYIEKEYMEGCGRFEDDKTKSIIDTLEHKGYLNHQFKQPEMSECNITYTNDIRIKITKEIISKLTNSTNNKTFVYRNTKETYPVFEGMKLQCTKNNPNLPVRNTCICSLKSVKDDKYTIQFLENEFTVDETIFLTHFISGYSITAHRVQGQTLDGIINIYEAERMTRNMIYMAVSRCRNIEQIRIDGTKYQMKYFHPHNYNQKAVEITLNKNKYNQGKIYALTKGEESTIYYIGSTTGEIEDRLKQHKRSGEQHKDSDIILLKNVCCDSRKQLEEIEREHVKLYQEKGCILTNKYLIKNKKAIESIKKNLNLPEYEIKVNKERSELTINYTVNGEKKKKKMRYIRMGYERAMKKMEEKKLEIYEDLGFSLCLD